MEKKYTIDEQYLGHKRENVLKEYIVLIYN